MIPALVTDLDYSDLEISKGSSAMYAFEQLFHETYKNRIRETKRYLLEYCRRDTLTMVRIFEVLESVWGVTGKFASIVIPCVHQGTGYGLAEEQQYRKGTIFFWFTRFLFQSSFLHACNILYRTSALRNDGAGRWRRRGVIHISVEIRRPACGKRAFRAFGYRLHTIAGHHLQRVLSTFLISLLDTWKVKSLQSQLLNIDYLINQSWRRLCGLFMTGQQHCSSCTMSKGYLNTNFVCFSEDLFIGIPQYRQLAPSLIQVGQM